MSNRLDVIVGPTGRRKWSDEAKGKIVAESFDPAETATGVARRYGISTSLMFLWRRKAKEGKLVVPADAIASFAPVVVEDEPEAARTKSAGLDPEREVLEIGAHGIVVRLDGATSEIRIAEIVRALAYEFY